MGKKIHNRKFALSLLIEVASHFGVKQLQIKDIDTMFNMFGMWSYGTVHYILRNEEMAQDVQTFVLLMNELGFQKVIELCIGQAELLSSLDFYRKCIKLSILAITLNCNGLVAAPKQFVGIIANLTGKAWSNGYVDIFYDEAKNFALDVIEHAFKTCGLDLKKYTPLEKMKAMTIRFVFEEHREIIDILIIENKWVTRNLENKNPRMNEKLFTQYVSYFLELHKEQPPSSRSILELIVRIVFLCMHSNYYENSVHQAMEYITQTMIFGARRNLI